MEYTTIKGHNAAPGAPLGWDSDKHGSCGVLPIRVFPPEALNDAKTPVQFCESSWRPTAQELEYLNNSGEIILRIYGWQPPVAIYIEPSEAVVKDYTHVG